MPEGEAEGCEFEVQYGFESMGTWKTAPPTAATVEDDGWGSQRWTMRISENIWPNYKYRLPRPYLCIGRLGAAASVNWCWRASILVGLA